MGFGGKTTLIGCKIGALNRLPASFFVSVAYDCWAFRRLGVVLDADDRRHHARGSTAIRRSPVVPMADQAGFPRTGREVVLTAPLERGRRSARSRSATCVLLNGRMFTGRDSVHSYLDEERPAGRPARRASSTTAARWC